MNKCFITTIECRMTSTRLPGKVIKSFGKYTSIELLIHRIKKSNFVDKIILATTKNKADDILVKLAKKNNIDYFRGSEKDVLGRLSNALKLKKEDNVIQLTGDNPFVDPEIIDYMCKKFLKSNINFLTNNGFMTLKKHHFPLGMNVSIFRRKDLIKISKITKKPEDREHPTLFFYRSKKKFFKIKNVDVLKKWRYDFKPRLTLDTNDDYKLLYKIFNYFYKNKNNINFNFKMIMEYLKKNRKLMNLNKNIKHIIPKSIEKIS